MKTPFARTICPSRAAFTLVELLAIVAVLGLLALVHVQGLSHTRNRSQDIVDFYNNKQLMAAANMYAAEHNDILPGCGWGTADDCWAYSKLTFGAQAESLRRGQLFQYVKDEKVFMCPIDKPDNLFYLRAILITSYTWNAAVCGYGYLTTPSGGIGSYKLAQFRPNAILQWEADGTSPFFFTDAACIPDEGISARHGTAATVGLISGGIQRVSLNQWFTSNYAGTSGQRGSAIPTTQLPNQLWCNPGNRWGR
ncbi:MAG TPA: type II secretion system protein [Verrucomicrobiae bacterium]|nr:type II secretion system protein [Verrucomicrobiae bacterium]